MPTDDPMTINERRKYLRLMQKAYQTTADRADRSRLLDTMAEVTGLNRKTLIRLMDSDLKRKRREKHRGQTYKRDVDQALHVIAESLDFICAERLTPTLVTTAEQLAFHGELTLTTTLREQLSQISTATVRRRLARFRQDETLHLPKAPARRHRMDSLHDIPMRRIPWDERHAGHFEVDLVHHSGPTTHGEYVHSLQMIDVATGWSERVALLGRSQLTVEDGFRRCLARLPFTVLEVHPDNGAEFLNASLRHFWRQQTPPPTLSRSRPYQKNDNRFVEQKNRSLVRVYLGNARLDTVAQTHLLNQLYDRMWLYYNFFQPVFRLQEKIVVKNGLHHYTRKRFDEPRTPFERLCATDLLAAEVQQVLCQLREQTNPRQLRTDIYTLLDELAALPLAKPGKTESVHLTLLPAGVGNACGNLSDGDRS